MLTLNQAPSSRISEDQKQLITAFSETQKWSDLLSPIGWHVGEANSKLKQILFNNAEKQCVGHVSTDQDTFYVYRSNDVLPCGRELTKFDVYTYVEFADDIDSAINSIEHMGLAIERSAASAKESAPAVPPVAIPTKRDLWQDAFPSEIPEKLRSLTDVAVEHQVRAIYKQPLHQLTTPIIGHDGKVSDVPTLQVAVEVMQFSVSVLAMQPEADKTIFLVTLRYKQAVGFYPLTAIKTEAERLRDLVARIVAPLAIEGSEESPTATVSGNQIRITWTEMADKSPLEDVDDIEHMYASEISPNLRSIRDAFFDAGREDN